MVQPVLIQHDEAGCRFVARLSGYEACLMYRREGRVLDCYHTYVPQAFRGRGMADQLCQAVFEYAKAHALTIIPSCSYISEAYLKRHPEYQPLTQSGPTSNPMVAG